MSHGRWIDLLLFASIYACKRKYANEHTNDHTYMKEL